MAEIIENGKHSAQEVPMGKINAALTTRNYWYISCWFNGTQW